MFLELILLGAVFFIVRHFYRTKCAVCENDRNIFLDFNYFIEYFKTLIWLKLSYKKKDKLRLGRHNPYGKTAQELGYVPNPYDVYMEEPHDLTGTNRKDEVVFLGGHEKTSILLRISRNDSQVVNTTIVINLPDGTSLSHPIHPDTRFQRISKDSFQSEGLKLTCLTALRKWRITFNGILKKSNTMSEKEDDNKGHHVQFTLIFSSMSKPETGERCRNELFADQLAKQNAKRNPNNLQRYNCDFEGYDQWGMFYGTLRIDFQEVQEILLWGVKKRIYDIEDGSNNIGGEYLYSFTDDGKCICLRKNVMADKESLKYGYIITPILSGKSIKWLYNESRLYGDSFENKSLHLSDGRKCFDITIQDMKNRITLLDGPKCETKMEAKFYSVLMDEEEGWAIGFHHNRSSEQVMQPIEIKTFLSPSDIKTGPRVVPFSNELCQSSPLCGGKGSSLALLSKLSELSKKFKVPQGIVITTESFLDHLRKNKLISEQIKHLEDIAWSKRNGSIEEACETVVEVIKHSKIDEGNEAEILNELTNIFGPDFESKMFAVRSSAIGEDSEDLSAAGQNETILGAKGRNNVINAVLQCWASQFKITSVQYKRQNGQELNPGMAVVVQEMVPSEVAGVMFTQHPLTGDSSVISISANYGLGESVVSGIADPDNYLLEKQGKDISIQKTEVGEKNCRITLQDEGGTETVTEKSETKNSEPCLNSRNLLALGRIGLMLEDRFGGARDVEWAIVGDEIYLLQSRPVTSTDVENEFELTYELDPAIDSKYAITTNANVGEVCPGAVTPLTLDVSMRGVELAFQLGNVEMQGAKTGYQYNPFHSVMAKYCSRLMAIDVINTMFFNNPKTLDKTASQIMTYCLYGHEVDVTEMRKRGIQRFGYMAGTKMGAFLIKAYVKSLFFDGEMERLENVLKKTVFIPEHYTDIHALFKYIKEKMFINFEASRVHCATSGFNTILNSVALSVLFGKNQDSTNDVWSDVSKLLSSCGDLVSASVPYMLEDLAKTVSSIKNWKEFQKLEPKEAKEWLQEESSVAGRKYREFINCHGHRCVKEFDLSSETWSMKPEVLVKILQTMNIDNGDVKTAKSTDKTNEELLDSLKTPLTMIQRKVLSFLLPRVKAAVARRERSKSLCVAGINFFRTAFRRLGMLMMWEGRIPEEDLIFFLNLEEIRQLLSNRSPRLVSKALRRKKLQPKLNTILLEEFMVGLPRPYSEEEIHKEFDANAVAVKGTPMSEGSAKGIARVIMNLAEASTIQPGDILVTRGTDIGWSPYFPILGGVVTELGGIISHGAVVAREYGLPCLIGAKRATKIIKTGDLVLLDGTKGMLIKLNQEN